MRPPSLLGAVVLVAALAVAVVGAAGCASLATPEAPGSGSPTPGATGGGTVAVSQQVKDGAQLYVDFACVRCHAPDGVGGIPNRLNKGGDDTIPPLNNVYREAVGEVHQRGADHDGAPGGRRRSRRSPASSTCRRGRESSTTRR